MTHKRRSGRSQKEDMQSKLSIFEALVNFNPYSIEEQIEKTYKQILKRMLNDFSQAMIQHEMNNQMVNYKMEQHYAAAISNMEVELEKLSFWIESNIINKDYLKQVLDNLEKRKEQKRQKLRSVLSLALKLSESIRDTRVGELQKVLQQQVEKYRIRQIKNTYEYDKTRSLQQKYQKEYDDHFQKVQQKYEKYIGKFQQRLSMFD